MVKLVSAAYMQLFFHTSSSANHNYRQCIAFGSAPRCSKSNYICWAKLHNNRREISTLSKWSGMPAWAGQTPAMAQNVSRPLSKRSLLITLATTKNRQGVRIQFLGNIREKSTNRGKPRKVVEHIVLFKTKAGFSDKQEKDMLDFLYTSQYYMRGIIAISLGRIVHENREGCTHAVYMRFPSKEVLAEYYKNTFQSRVLNEYIIPYCHGTISVDYEAEVEDDIVPLFRRGEDFEYGVEFLLLISVHEGVSVEIIGDALNTFGNLVEDFGSSIIQYTQGKNLSGNCKDYTHGVMIRFPSEEALQGFTSSPSYTDIWKQKVLPIAKRTLVVYFLIDPIGTTLM